MPNISGTIKSIQNIMRKDAGVDGDAQRISQLAWMIFYKIFDDKERDYELQAELNSKEYKSPIPEELRWRSWATDDEGITGDALLDFINNKLFPTLKELPVLDAKDRGNIVRSVFEDSYNYMKSGTLLRQVVNTLNAGIDFTKQEDRHLFNDLYEQILKDLQSAGNAGEYYTPRAATQFIVEMVDPKLGETVLDPACGTAGFLINTIEHIRGKGEINTVEDRETLQNSIQGVEKKPLPHMLATTNMLLHRVEYPSIRHDNLLSYSLTDWSNKNRVDVIVTNPPFGGMEEDGIEKNFPASYRTRETANLFLYLIMHILKDGGRCGMVLPDGFLFGDGVSARIKAKLLETCNLHTIVKLPKGVFNPYTGIKTNLLFFEKGKPTKDIWYFEHPYPEGYKSYSKSKPMRAQEFDLEREWWNNREENEYAWKVTIDKIKERNYNLDFKNPNNVELGINHSTAEVLDLLENDNRKFDLLIEEIKTVL
jgi:type I restriction enzyme M protein